MHLGAGKTQVTVERALLLSSHQLVLLIVSLKRKAKESQKQLINQLN